MFVWEGLTNSYEKKRTKGKEEKERYTHLNAEFQRTSRRGKKDFLSDQWKEIEDPAVIYVGECFAYVFL